VSTDHGEPTREIGFQGTQVRDDGTGPMLVLHKQRLIVVSGPDRGLEKEVESTRIVVGTSPNADLQLSDRTVSRMHCEIAVRDERYVIKDLDSTNGTEVNGTPVVEAILSPGSRVRLGDTEILFEPKKKWERVPDAATDHFGEMYGSSAVMRNVFAMLAKVAKTDLSAILVGETGTGKELAARAVHEYSARGHQPFVVVDCGAVSKNLIESELFGHEKGSFTGADRQRIGAFEQADKGTIFLDEIGELPIDLQPKLLRALERREVKRLGASRHIEVDVRVVAATHRNLAEMIKAGTFREDLYYRLAEVVVKLPPLRERREDIAVITQRIVEEHVRGGSIVRAIASDAMDLLMHRPWQGNVRELRNVLRRAIAMAPGDVIRPEDLALVGGERLTGPSAPIAASAPSDAAEPNPDVADELPIKDARERWIAPMEREYLVRLMKRCDGDLDRASQEAGVHRKSLERLLRQHGLRASDLRRG
jgi:DNA-binding NtrC family response regulator